MKKTFIGMANDYQTLRSNKENYRMFIERHARQKWGATVNWKVSGKAIEAEIIRGNWVVKCECNSAYFAQSGEPFFCADCLMQYNDGKAIPVKFPSAEKKKEIEDLLMERDFPNNRNWLKHESTANLKAQNDKHIRGK